MKKKTLRVHPLLLVPARSGVAERPACRPTASCCGSREETRTCRPHSENWPKCATSICRCPCSSSIVPGPPLCLGSVLPAYSRGHLYTNLFPGRVRLSLAQSLECRRIARQPLRSTRRSAGDVKGVAVHVPGVCHSLCASACQCRRVSPNHHLLLAPPRPNLTLPPPPPPPPRIPFTCCFAPLSPDAWTEC